MRNTIFLGIFCCLSLFTYSQNRSLPVEIILKNNDTLIGEMKIKVNHFNKDLIHTSSFNEKVKFNSSEGKKSKINTKEVSELTFTDFKGNSRKFVRIKEFKHRIVEVIYSNKVSWYKDYYFDFYNQTEKTVDELFDENGEQFTIGLFNSYRNKLRKFTKDNPNMSELITNNDMKKDEIILKVIKMYEKEL